MRFFFSKSSKNITLNILFSFILIFIIFFLFKSGILRNYLIGGPEIFFIDIKHNYIHWLECHNVGINHQNCQIMNYGKIFFLIPFNETLKIFYINYLPPITILLFVLVVTFLLNPKNKVEYFIIMLAILNPTTLLLIERMNFDIFIFLLFVIIAFNRVYIFNWLLFFYCFLLKLFPIFSGTFIFIENKKRSSNFLFILLVAFAAIILYLLFTNYFNFTADKIFTSGGKASYWHIFSLNTIPKVLKYFGLNYIFSILLVYPFFFYALYRFYKSRELNQLINNQNFFTSKWRLFLLGGNLLLFCFILYSNYSHREVFLILLIPQLLLLSSLKNKLSNLIIYFLIFRYLFLFIYGATNAIDSTYHIDEVRYFSGAFLFAMLGKGLLDFVLMSAIGAVLIKINFSILKNFFLTFRL